MTVANDAPHLPVMLSESLEGLHVKPGRWFVDGTFGAGGHTRAILAQGGSVLAVDRDPHAQQYTRTITPPAGTELRFISGDFRHLDAHAREAGLTGAAGILLDLGVSSMQLDEGERGFAFRQEGPLDMRMGPADESAADVVNSYDQEDLASLIYRYGEERHSRRIARRITEARERTPITTTQQLAEIIASAYPPGYRREHPARRTFQALRIHVNDELGALTDALRAAEQLLEPHGRLVVISYHSLEDRIVKHAFRDSPQLKPVTKRPLTATDDEVALNPRARSAKLRIAEKTPPETTKGDSA
jgi:16S rRNA (cytosine1402-N4)-methyltransferase